jgi:voltage-gated potassium channel
VSKDKTSKSEQPSEKGGTKGRVGKRPRLISNLLFLDVLFNRQTGPIFIYAAIVIMIGAALYHWLEGWGWLDSFYFVVITLTTIGYGDLTPTTSVTKFLTIFYGINGVILLLMLFDVIRTLRGWDVRDAAKAMKEKEGGWQTDT